MQQNNSTHIVIIFLLTLITLNLFILDLKIFAPGNAIQLSDITSIATPIPSITINYQPLTNNLSCPATCLSAIQQATAAASQSSLQGDPSQRASGQSREFYIPLGTGSTSKSDWDDLTATEIVIDPGNYGQIKEAYFIASLSNPTQNGQIEAQLYNVTDKHIAWGSHIIMNGPSAQTITSGKITLDIGNKLYRVELKSTLGFQASLENAKIRIITQ